MSAQPPRLLLFHRRLLVLGLLLLVALGMLAWRAAQLTMTEGQDRLAKAQERLNTVQWLPTWRGRLLDRRGRILATDEPTFDVAVPWDVVTGDRANAMARRDASEAIGADAWAALSPEERASAVDLHLDARRDRLDAFWNQLASLGSISRDTLDRRLDVIRGQVQRTAASYWVRQEDAHRARFGIDTDWSPGPIREQRDVHVVLPRVDDQMAMRCRMLGQEQDGWVDVRHSRRRSYPMRSQIVTIDGTTLPRGLRRAGDVEIAVPDVGDVVIGAVRGSAWAEDVERLPFRRSDGSVDLAGYRAGDEVGSRGLEASLEGRLRGARGRVVVARDGSERDRLPPAGGEDITLTLDLALQARVQAILSPELGLAVVQPWHRNSGLPVGTPLRGAIVVLDVDSGEVLAMASTPTPSMEVEPDALPWLNRAAFGLYPPGSIVKPLVLAAGITDGVLAVNDTIACSGHFFPDVHNAARCWIYREKYGFATHGDLAPVEAIARSCNVFFYEVGSRLGLDRLLWWLERMGLGAPLGRRLTDADADGRQGHVPDGQRLSQLARRGELAFETVSMAIGQGEISWTPLHAAAAYAALARGGGWLTPSVISIDAKPLVPLGLDPRGVEMALDGLRDAVSEGHGTGTNIIHGSGDREPIFNLANIERWGKTGTAEAPPLRIDRNRDGTPDLVVQHLDHAWFLVMAAPRGADRPTVVAAILIEYGGSGGRAAGPVANQVLHALADEGYLGGRRR